MSVIDYKENKSSTKKLPLRNNSSKKILPKQDKNDNFKIIQQFPQKSLQNIEKNTHSFDIVTAMTQKIGSLEYELRNVKKEMREMKLALKQKDMHISKLISEMNKIRTVSIPYAKNVDLPAEFYCLKNKVLDMERFLFNCGLQLENQKVPEEVHLDEEWKQMYYMPNFDNIINVIQRMNLENSEPQIIQTELGAKLQTCDVLQLTLYANGMISGDIPFRTYTQPTVQEYFTDIQDGFYPSELQENNPEGVIFKVCDRRHEIYNPTRKCEIPFKGHGTKLGSEHFQEQSNMLKTVWHPMGSVYNDFEQSSFPSKKNFINYEFSASKYNSSLTVKNGVMMKVLDEDVQENLQVIPVKTIMLNSPSKRKNEITLKVKGIEGVPVYFVSVLTQDTVGTLRSLLPIEDAYTLAYRNDKNKVQQLTLLHSTLRNYGISQSCVLFAVKVL